MHKSTSELPTVIDTPAAQARQHTEFGDVSDYDELVGEYMRFEAGTDITPLLEGLPGDLCQSPHWGYVLDGTLHVTYTDGSSEINEAGELVYWPPGHTARAETDVEVVLFSPRDPHVEVLEHIRSKVAD